MVHGLTPYTPGEQPQIDGLIKLNTNENPYPPSAAVDRALKEVPLDALRLYPDPESTDLRKAVGELWGIQTDQIFVGNGSDEVLAFVFQGLLSHSRPLAFPDITYSFYPTYCALYGIRHTLIALEPDLSLNLDHVPADCGAVIFPNPNAPTGRALARSAIAHLARQRPDLLIVVDEAYVDFGAESCVPLTQDMNNVLVTQSLSKSRALAGLRVGFAIGSPKLISALSRIKNSFNSYPLDRLAQAGAASALRDRLWFESNRQAVIAGREKMAKGLSGLGFDVVPSQANFLFVRHPQQTAERLAQSLREQRILVRHFNQPRINQYLRITVGTDQQIDTLLSALNKILSGR